MSPYYLRSSNDYSVWTLVDTLPSGAALRGAMLALPAPVVVHGRMGGEYKRDVEGVLHALDRDYMLISVRDEHRAVLKHTGHAADATGWRWHHVYGFAGTKESYTFLRGPIKVLKLLAMAAREGARVRKSAEALAAIEAARAHRVGQCGVCEGDFIATVGRLTRGTPTNSLVLHGYQRPGTGVIDGRCPGVGWTSWELSDHAARSYLINQLKPRREMMAAAADRLRVATRIVRYETTYRLGEARFEKAREEAVAELQRELESLDREIARRQKRLDEWAPQKWPRIDPPTTDEGTL